MRKYVFNPIANKSPQGAVVKGTTVTYTLKVSKFEHPTSAFFVIHQDGESPRYEEMVKEFVDDRYINYTYTCKFSNIGLFWYHFEVSYNNYSTKLIRSENLDIVESHADSDYLQLVINNESCTDNNFHKGIIYHIFVDRFNRVGEIKSRKGLNLVENWEQPLGYEYDEKGNRVNRNCYGGNFEGIIKKLPYLKSLNVKTIYLSPIFEAHSSHKYNVADYSTVDSMFGGKEKLEELIRKAKRQGIKIIIDGVFNHTGSDSIYFNKEGRYKTIGAYQSENSKYYSWYDFDRYPDSYSCWWGIKTLPQTNENSGFFDYISGKNGIINKYMALGLAGLRLDVVDELSNNFLHSICKATRSVDPKALIVGEVWEDASSKIAYDERKQYFLGGYLDSVTNYPMKNAILNFVKYGNHQEFVNIVNLILDQYPKSVQNNLMNILDTHDTLRAITYLGANFSSPEYSENINFKLSEEEYERGKKLLKLASIMQYTVMGVPTVFYGDEAGIQGVKDPYCRATYPWGKEDTDLIDWYTTLGNLRNNKVLHNGNMSIKYANNSVIIYEREKDKNKVIVAVNMSAEKFEFVVSKNMNNYFTGEYINGKIILEPETAIVLC